MRSCHHSYLRMIRNSVLGKPSPSRLQLRRYLGYCDNISILFRAYSFQKFLDCHLISQIYDVPLCSIKLLSRTETIIISIFINTHSLYNGNNLNPNSIIETLSISPFVIQKCVYRLWMSLFLIVTQKLQSIIIMVI